MGHQAFGPLELWNYPVWLENIVPQNIDGTDHPDHIVLASLDTIDDVDVMGERLYQEAEVGAKMGKFGDRNGYGIRS
ncbi:heme peroxidase [Artemisia annua]|uniref:Heme peroxidase n=1 Tax=Artemisia annua TaxID=35608 RepID=A0A2U1MQN7_ARTAN|nr:heme peroxidase [Artemisia annua]